MNKIYNVIRVDRRNLKVLKHRGPIGHNHFISACYNWDDMLYTYEDAQKVLAYIVNKSGYAENYAYYIASKSF